MKYKKIFPIVLRLVAASILLQTLYFKLNGQPESVQLFSKLGVELWGRIGTGIIELITSVLLLVSSTMIYGAILVVGVMSGAVLSHLFILGISSDEDGGELFILVLVVLGSCLGILWFIRNESITLVNKWFGSAHRKVHA